MPDFITGTWQQSGPWLMCDRAITRDVDLVDISIEDAPFCPECLSDSTIRLSLEHRQFPLSYYCRNCGLVWLPYAVRCPDCDAILYNLTCPKCNYTWDEELIKEMHKEGW